jgi:3-methyladenine DNA glycosylase/8-oxoguanine DNA glycosylase
VSVTPNVFRAATSPFDLARTLMLHAVGLYDPTARLGAGGFVKVHLDAEGRAARHVVRYDGEAVTIETTSEDGHTPYAWDTVFPIDDGLASFAPDHPLLARLAHLTPGLRLLRVPWLFDVAVAAVLQQRVRFTEAARDFRRIAERWGKRTPFGVALPNARMLAAVPVFELQAMGLDPKRARALIAIAREQSFRDFLYGPTPRDELRKRLERIAGIGPWTTETILGVGTGDPDAVPIGDLHLPSLVVSALTGEPDGDDARMVEVLEPYRGQRYRVIRLLMTTQRRVSPVRR